MPWTLIVPVTDVPAVGAVIESVGPVVWAEVLDTVTMRVATGSVITRYRPPVPTDVVVAVVEGATT